MWNVARACPYNTQQESPISSLAPTPCQKGNHNFLNVFLPSVLKPLCFVVGFSAGGLLPPKLLLPDFYKSPVDKIPMCKCPMDKKIRWVKVRKVKIPWQKFGGMFFVVQKSASRFFQVSATIKGLQRNLCQDNKGYNQSPKKYGAHSHLFSQTSHVD